MRPPERPRSVGNLAHLGPRGSGALVHALALTCWIGLLLLPNVTTVAFANAWVTDPRHLVAVSIWVVVALWAMLPRRWFLVLTYPVIVAGAVVLAADVQRSVNLFDLIAVWHTFTHGEVINAVRPYLGPFCFFALALLVPLTILWRGGTAQGLSRTGRLGVAGSGVLLVLALPQRAWLESWPVALLPAPFEAQAAGIGILLSPIANIRISPRDRKQSWNATRKHAPAVNETYVLVIGESVRSDRLNGCGGRAEVTAPPRGSLLYCDVLAGSSGTETSVPLLVSRELPGHYERVSRDATVVKAFEEAGFETFWISTHVRAIAWPDAQNQVYDAQPATDRAALLPLLDQALARPAARKLIVLHAYNSHSPYAERYAAATAPFAVDPRIVQAKLPTAANLDTWWNAYDNAIDESMRLLDAVVARLRTERGQAFFMFTPDHGENMLDDHRQLLEHALKFPTLWDTRVPAIVWANSDWQLAHRDKWRTLAANREQPLMHMDVAPTLLGAAGIDYDDERALPVDLTTRIAGERVRVTQARAGETVTADALVRQARAPANADVLARLAQVAEN